MDQHKKNHAALKYLTPDNLYDQLTKFTAGMSVTKGAFELVVPNCTLEDIEWNHMDQMHRPSIHHTYEEGIRIAMGHDFAVSLTKWGKWPLFLTVTDVYVAKGLFYQSITIAGIIFLHSIISMEKIDATSIKLKDEWYIASHKLFRLLHKPLNKKLYRLNERLQQEDEQIRQGRFALRKQGFTFKTDQPDYYNSNRLTTHTIYPLIQANAGLSILDITSEPTVKKIGELEFIVKKEQQENNITYLFWPHACPHEGGPLSKGEFCHAQIICPWHGLRFSAAKLSLTSPYATKYGFEYSLIGEVVYIKQVIVKAPNEIAEAELFSLSSRRGRRTLLRK